MTLTCQSSMRAFQPLKVKAPAGFADWVMPQGFVDLEIGCGVGFHPMAFAKEHSDRTLIAIEHTKNRFESFYRRFVNHKRPPQVIPIHADAVAWVTNYIPADSLSRIFLYYPNPYPKKRDLNKRWHAMPFMGHLLTKLKNQGTVHFATNEEFYKNEFCQFMEQSWGLIQVTSCILANSSKPRPHFEKKYLDRGLKCFDVVFQKLL